MEKRKCGIDIFRIMCCLGVLNYHVIDDILEISGGVERMFFTTDQAFVFQGSF